MIEDRINAFPDGNSIVAYNPLFNTLFVGNSEGIIKIYNLKVPDLEPTSLDVLENLTSFKISENNIILTNTDGNLEIIDLKQNRSKGLIYRSELPLRDSVIINDNKRVVCGGDDQKLIFVSIKDKNTCDEFELSEQIVNISYTFVGEMISVSLSNSNVEIYSVTNEKPYKVYTIKKILVPKINTSFKKVDFIGEHKDELICTKTVWSSDGMLLLVPTEFNMINIYNRDNSFILIDQFNVINSGITDFDLSSDKKVLSVLYNNNYIKIFNFESKIQLKEIQLNINNGLSLSLIWNDNNLFVGTTIGIVFTFNDVLDSFDSIFEKKIQSKLFVNENDNYDNNTENENLILSNNSTPKKNNELKRYTLHDEDSLVIDQEELNYFKNDYLSDFSNKKKKKNHIKINKTNDFADFISNTNLIPYSNGSTPWNNDDKSMSESSRRYLTMNMYGYVWAVKSFFESEIQGHQNITVSFFDRSKQKDYHFVDYVFYDLCCMNEEGILLGYSTFSNKNNNQNAKLYYRKHNSESSTWVKEIPLLKSEYLTCISITNYSQSESDSEKLIIVGSNFGHLRFFNLFGICINIIKTLPILCLISSSNGILFIINQITTFNHTFSIIDMKHDFVFIQQDINLPVIKSTENLDAPLLKSVFFNETNDPCLVSNYENTLMILMYWNQPKNSRWIPVMNCYDKITEKGSVEKKKTWGFWPLGLNEDKLSCLVLKNNDQYPGFPLSIPIELDIELPIVPSLVNIFTTKNDHNHESSLKTVNDVQENEIFFSSCEENFLRSHIMIKILTESLKNNNSIIYKNTISKRIADYDLIFNKSLLKMFGELCKHSNISKAYCICKMIKSDKALHAAYKISERMNLNNLSIKINKLRDDIHNINQS